MRALAISFNDTVAKLDALLRPRRRSWPTRPTSCDPRSTALRLRLENLERDVAPAGGGDLEGALAEVARLSRLVDGLLELARADRGQATPVPLDAAAIVAERLEAWSAWPTSGAWLRGSLAGRTDRPRDPGASRAGAGQPAGQRLDASPGGAAFGGPDRGRAEVHVIDDGPGLTEEERRHAFDRFWRTGREGGAGLGLAIVRRLVESDGGSAELLARDGDGRRRRAAPTCERHPHSPARRRKPGEIPPDGWFPP